MKKPTASAVQDPLAVLEVLDRLEVGPIQLHKDSVTAPYRIAPIAKISESGEPAAGDLETVGEITFRFEEEVFDPASPADQNLAALMVSQVALNYGLFARRIILHGPFEAADRRFLEEMLENTSREIYVKKILGSNPFLLPPLQDLEAVQQPRYTRARLEFVSEAGPFPGLTEPWPGDRERYCVLSSGGKDSLLSFGLLQELGWEVHPIFVNESGRHWFTALNAYRHFSRQVPGTARVWTNSDRLFNAMLRHLPFIRPDFSRLRADIYPIRLWTVAVFLFGVLPLLRKRGIGRLVIGDEYDTTVRHRHQGIPHYDGLFDQSRYFDDALSRYFRAKQWQLTQFSILRPLSELLIQKVLAERYPQLLRQQVSCHAAHTEEDRVLPCGRCEKCRRIVGMLRSLGLDPTACGYSAQQQPEILRALAEKGVHQEAVAAEHMAYLLAHQGLLPTGRIGALKAHHRPEALSLRFHSERAPITGIPASLRKPLYEKVLEHGLGALRRQGRQWTPVDLRQDPEMTAPYPFDPAQEPATRGNATFLWGELTWPEAQERLRSVDTALLPVGAVEQHGPHLPLDVDAYDADYLARQVAAACSHPRPLVLPLIPYGVSYHHDDFKGTLSVSNEALSRLVYEIGMSAARNGINKLIIINGHGGNGPTLHFAAQMINRDSHIFTCVESGETSDADIDAMASTHNDVHAGEIETSTTLAIRPELVKMEAARASVPDFSSDYLQFSSQRSVTWYARTEKISASGVLGNPEVATAEKGHRMWEIMIRNLVELVEHLKDLSLEQIYQRRY
jgi:creatinine amidohydrolase/Fe(II)-dependent formamide hydrolase-like protein/7-cyano-7-deazaguanine synthase in queuosine biosynthesis